LHDLVFLNDVHVKTIEHSLSEIFFVLLTINRYIFNLAFRMKVIFVWH